MLFQELGSGKPTVGINTVFDTNQAHNTSATFDSSNNKVVVAYTDNTSNHHGMIVVGTVTGTDIEFGTLSSLNLQIVVEEVYQ